LLTPGQLAGIELIFAFKADTCQKLLGGLSRARVVGFFHLLLTDGDVVQHGEVLEQVETLKDHADVRSLDTDLSIISLVQSTVTFFVADQVPVHVQFSGVMLF